jgi:tetratricopeptide (TPR) repeat protein
LSIFGSVMEGDTKGVSIQTLILAAEAARRDAKVDRAVKILEAAYAMQPERLSVLNNLVYLLAQDPQTLSRARALMPKLLEIGSESFAVMDTAAIVYLRSGDLESAKVWMDKATASLKKDSYSANEVRLNAAELQMRRGEYAAARESIETLRQDATRTDFIDQKARSLLRDIQSLEQ